MGVDVGIDLMKVLENENKINRINLEGNKLLDDVAVTCETALIGNATVKYLELTNNAMKEKAGASLGRVISQNVTLETLVLDKNQFAKSLELLMDGLKDNKVLKTFQLRDCSTKKDDQVQAKFAVAFGNSIKINTTLLKMDFTENWFTVEGFGAMMEGLHNAEGNNHLQTIVLASCQITDPAVQHFALMVANNHTLKTVNLRDNGIGNPGGLAVAATLKDNKGLASLDIQRNKTIAFVTYASHKLQHLSPFFS